MEYQLLRMQQRPEEVLQTLQEQVLTFHGKQLDLAKQIVQQASLTKDVSVPCSQPFRTD
jgi:hypothetical protein